MIALTPEMRAAACRRMGVDELDPWTEAALVDVLALVERDNNVTPKRRRKPNWRDTPGCMCARTGRPYRLCPAHGITAGGAS